MRLLGSAEGRFPRICLITIFTSTLQEKVMEPKIAPDESCSIMECLGRKVEKLFIINSMLYFFFKFLKRYLLIISTSVKLSNLKYGLLIFKYKNFLENNNDDITIIFNECLRMFA